MKMGNDRRNYLLFLVTCSGLVATARAMTLSFLVIKLHESFGLGSAIIGALLGAGPLVGAVVAPFAGSLSDRMERKPVLTLTLFMTAVALLGMAVAESVLTFCLAQIVSAVALAVYEPVSRALMSDVCPEEQRLRFFLWRYTTNNVGWAIGPLIGVSAGATASILFFSASFLYAFFAIALLLITVPYNQRHNVSTEVQHTSVFSCVRAAIRDPRLAFFVLGGTLLIAVHGQYSATLAPYLSTSIENGNSIFAYLVSINGFVVLLGNPIARRFIESVGARHALVMGCGLFFIGEISFMFSNNVLTFSVAMTISTLGEILVVPSEYMMVDDISNDLNRGSYFGAHSFSTIGNFIGPTLGGVLLGAYGGAAMFLLFSAFAVASALFFVVGARMPPPTASKRDAKPPRIESPISSIVRTRSA